MEVGKTYKLNPKLVEEFIQADPSYNHEIVSFLDEHGPRFIVNNMSMIEGDEYVNNITTEDGAVGCDSFSVGCGAMYFELRESEFEYFEEVSDLKIIQVSVSESNAQEVIDLIKSTFNLA
ncbi:hypothetical protein A73_102 [Escherichia phage A73]|uniref:Uncharacterized protein n=1 Tax=Escherichia phage A73 TaxID=3003819 RepID=A0AAE9VXA7_9CAUD|nr:hypothetical protein A73_102 [Escherichia phage A73]WBF77852.1 hypothetical protein W70_88 [Escherichia phage W70]